MASAGELTALFAPRNRLIAAELLRDMDPSLMKEPSPLQEILNECIGLPSGTPRVPGTVPIEMPEPDLDDLAIFLESESEDSPSPPPPMPQTREESSDEGSEVEVVDLVEELGPGAGISVEGTVHDITKSKPNYFGEEDLSYVDHGAVKGIIDQAFVVTNTPPNASDMTNVINHIVTQIGRFVYGNSEHPDNITCFIPTAEAKHALVYTRKGWIRWPAVHVSDIVYQTSLELLFKYQPCTPRIERYPENVAKGQKDKKYPAV